MTNYATKITNLVDADDDEYYQQRKAAKAAHKLFERFNAQQSELLKRRWALGVGIEYVCANTAFESAQASLCSDVRAIDEHLDELHEKAEGTRKRHTVTRKAALAAFERLEAFKADVEAARDVKAAILGRQHAAKCTIYGASAKGPFGVYTHPQAARVTLDTDKLIAGLVMAHDGSDDHTEVAAYWRQFPREVLVRCWADCYRSDADKYAIKNVPRADRTQWTNRILVSAASCGSNCISVWDTDVDLDDCVESVTIPCVDGKPNRKRIDAVVLEFSQKYPHLELHDNTLEATPAACCDTCALNQIQWCHDTDRCTGYER